MKWRTLLFLMTFLLASSFIMDAQAQKREKWMTLKKMDKVLEKEAAQIEGKDGIWEMIYKERLVFVITDDKNNRMRIFTPVIESTSLPSNELENMLRANFHTALDAKYSIYEGFVISVFTHPLKELTKDQLIDALWQVVTLADTYGTTYTSTEFIFGDAKKEAQPKKRNEKPAKKI